MWFGGFLFNMELKLRKYLLEKGYNRFDLKAVIFDMDGVLYDSMPAHAKSWQQTFEEFNYKTTTPSEFFLHEGRLGTSTIQLVTEREFNREPTQQEINNIYNRKSELFNIYNRDKTLPGAKETLDYVREKGLIPILVTGSGQHSLLDKLDVHFPGIFSKETMVTAYDVIKGKPNPEPFIKGLERGGGLKPNQAIVIENAPLGIESSVGAGIFTIAVNTGPLNDDILLDAGASIVLHSMSSLLNIIPEIIKLTKSLRV